MSNPARQARRAFDPRLLEGSIPRSLFLLAVPIMGANILQVAYQVIDAFWVGRLGADAVAAVSVTMPIMFVLIAAGMGFAIAGTTLIAQYTGARDHDMVDHVAAQTLLKTEEPISKIRGRLFDYRGVQLIPTFHPAYLLRNPSSKRDVWEDMKLVKSLLNSHPQNR